MATPPRAAARGPARRARAALARRLQDSAALGLARGRVTTRSVRPRQAWAPARRAVPASAASAATVSAATVSALTVSAPTVARVLACQALGQARVVRVRTAGVPAVPALPATVVRVPVVRVLAARAQVR